MAKEKFNFVMEKWSGESIAVDGWWTPVQGVQMKGILIGSIPQSRSPKLKSDQLLFELIEDFEGNEESPVKSAEDTDESVALKAGQILGIAKYKSIETLHPEKLGHVVYLTMTGERPIQGQSPMKLFDTQTSQKAVRAISKPGAAAEPKVPFEV